ncbi:MAG: hypothetical protein KAS36_07275 [Anaerolineales bacterium]|nr:hypothetical protein [Anaerolineales bacterium]
MAKITKYAVKRKNEKKPERMPYYHGLGSWTDNIGDAKFFDTAAEAVVKAKEKETSNKSMDLIAIEVIFEINEIELEIKRKMS